MLLCESCALALVNEHERKLDRLIDSLGENGDDGGFGIRADASFLHPRGELLRRMEGFSITFLKNPITHAYDDVGFPAPTEETGSPTSEVLASRVLASDVLASEVHTPEVRTPKTPPPKVDKMGDFMALNGYWDNRDDDEPGMFKEEEQWKHRKAKENERTPEIAF